MRHIAVIAKVGPPQGIELAARLGAWLRERSLEVWFDSRTAAAMGVEGGFDRTSFPADADLAVVAGGDGTLLSVARAAAPKGVPILGVNFGSLGFLTELQPDEMYDGLERVLANEYRIEERFALRVRYAHDADSNSEYIALNDAVITKSALARMITLDMEIDGEEVATYTSDGLIVSTPTGSTAYNLSAGGPILDPTMSAFVISPICPHSMTHRPLVIPGSGRVTVTLRDADEEVYLTLDGQVGFPMHPRASVLVTRYDPPVRLVRMSGRSLFEPLRRKLRWGFR